MGDAGSSFVHAANTVSRATHARERWRVANVESRVIRVSSAVVRRRPLAHSGIEAPRLSPSQSESPAEECHARVARAGSARPLTPRSLSMTIGRLSDERHCDIVVAHQYE